MIKSFDIVEQQYLFPRHDTRSFSLIMKGTPSYLDFSSDDTRILLALGSNILVYLLSPDSDSEGPRMLTVLTGHHANVTMARFLPQIDHIVSISVDRTFKGLHAHRTRSNPFSSSLEYKLEFLHFPEHDRVFLALYRDRCGSYWAKVLHWI